MALSHALWARVEQVLPPYGERQAWRRQRTTAGSGPLVAEEAK